MNGTAPQHIKETAGHYRPRLGFLGVGWIGRHRMEAIARSGTARIAAIADACPDVAKQAAEMLPNAACADDLDGLLAMDLDGIVIATPSACHAEQAIRALERGVAVFCQKPLARTEQETRMVLEAARRADRLLSVDFSYRFTNGMQLIRELLASGSIGDIYAVDLVFHNAYGPDKAWFYQPKLSGGGCVMDLGSHLVDLALWSLDFPKIRRASSRLFCGGSPIRTASDTVEDFAVAEFELDTGTVVRLACSWKLPAGCDAVIEASFYGTKGGARFHNVNGSFYDFTAERFHGTAKEILSIPPDQWGGRAAVAWAQRLAANPSFDPAADKLIDVAQALDAVYGR